MPIKLWAQKGHFEKQYLYKHEQIEFAMVSTGTTVTMLWPALVNSTTSTCSPASLTHTKLWPVLTCHSTQIPVKQHVSLWAADSNLVTCYMAILGGHGFYSWETGKVGWEGFM